MVKKFQNNSKYNICAISQGKKLNIKPGQIVSGPDELSQYNGLAEVTKKTKYEIESKNYAIIILNKFKKNSLIF